MFKMLPTDFVPAVSFHNGEHVRDKADADWAAWTFWILLFQTSSFVFLIQYI